MLPGRAPAAAEYRSLWVDSWGVGIRGRAEIEELLAACRENNINTVIVEVRKIGDAYYRSSLEPRATNILDGSSFDPLGTLVQLAHDTSRRQRRVAVHAWFVMQRVSTGGTLSPLHVLARHPEYVMSDQNGATQAGSSLFLDPGHPGAVDHNLAVILDCATRYDLDGVNLDYIRYPEAAGEWGYNPVSVARYNRIHRKQGKPSGSDPAWDAWRRECVTLAVRKIYVHLAKLRRDVVLTADTINWGSGYNNYTQSSPYAGVFQDWAGWLDAGILDYNALMNYATDNARFQGWTRLSLEHDDRRGSIIGIGAYLQTSLQNGLDQLLWARAQGAAGLAIYDWMSEVNNAPASRTEFYRDLKSQVFPQWADPPEPAWKSQPTTGMIEGIITASGMPLDHCTVSLRERPTMRTVTDGSGWYGQIDVPPGQYALLIQMPGYPQRAIPVALAAGDIRTVSVDILELGSRWETY